MIRLLALIASIVLFSFLLINTCVWVAQNRRNAVLRPRADAPQPAARMTHPMNSDDEITVYIGDGVSKSHAIQVKTAIDQIEHDRPDARLKVMIDTNGGVARYAWTIFTLLHNFALTHEVIIVVAGKCHSAGSVILLAVPLRSRYMTRGSEILIHSPRVQGKRTEATRVHGEFLAWIYSELTYLSHESLSIVMRTGKDYAMTPQKALLLGFVSHVI